MREMSIEVAAGWCDSPPVRYALRQFGYPAKAEIVDFLELVLVNVDRIEVGKEVGVSWDSRRPDKPWRVVIRRKHIGNFQTAEQAIAARDKAVAA